MRFVSDRIGDLVLKELSGAAAVSIAVAFFSPENSMLTKLAGLKNLRLIVSEEFKLNNPYKLEKLTTAEIRVIPPDADEGRLHAKIFIVERQNGTFWVLVGSANLTYQGMCLNQEACVVMESQAADDKEAINKIRDWFNVIYKASEPFNLLDAKWTFDSYSKYRLVLRPKEKPAETPCWVLKTTVGPTGKDYWPNFLKEAVIAIGWEEIDVDPAKASIEQLREAVRATYEGMNARRAATKIKKFVDLNIDDIILICRGYSSNQKADVHVYGIARVTGPFCAKPPKKGEFTWRFKHDAVIQPINEKIPRDFLASASGKDSMLETIHHIEKAGFFNEIVRKLEEYGVHVQV